MREERKQQWLLQMTLSESVVLLKKKTQERDRNDRVTPTTMRTIMKMDSSYAKLSALQRPQRGADTCSNYGLQQVILHGNIVGHDHFMG